MYIENGIAYADKARNLLHISDARYIGNHMVELYFDTGETRILDSPNRETIEAMLEAERIAKDPKVKAYSVDEAFEELDK